MLDNNDTSALVTAISPYVYFFCFCFVYLYVCFICTFSNFPWASDATNCTNHHHHHDKCQQSKAREGTEKDPERGHQDKAKPSMPIQWTVS